MTLTPSKFKLDETGQGDVISIEQLNEFIDYNNAAISHLEKEHDTDHTSVYTHSSVRWATAAACVEFIHKDEYHARGARIIWSTGFKEPPTFSDDALVPLDARENPTGKVYYLNYTLPGKGLQMIQLGGSLWGDHHNISPRFDQKLFIKHKQSDGKGSIALHFYDASPDSKYGHTSQAMENLNRVFFIIRQFPR